MIRVMSSSVDDVAAAASIRPTAAIPTRAAGKASTAKTFEATLQDATSSATGGAAAPEPSSKPTLRPTGETLRADAGHPYAHITSGPDAGMYLNMEKGNPREGEAFRIELRNGLTLHVYGSGASEQIEVVRPVAATGGTPAAG